MNRVNAKATVISLSLSASVAQRNEKKNESHSTEDDDKRRRRQNRVVVRICIVCVRRVQAIHTMNISARVSVYYNRGRSASLNPLAVLLYMFAWYQR